MAYITQNRGCWGIYERYKSESGQWRNKLVLSIGRVGKRKANFAFDEWKENGDSNSNNITFQKIIEDFQEDLDLNVKEGIIKPTTVKLHHYFLERYIIYFAEKKVSPIDIKYKKIQEFKVHLKTFTLSNRTKNLILSTLSKLLRYCVKCEIIPQMPIIEKFKENKNNEIQRLTLEQCKIILQHSSSNLKFYISFLLFSGVRPYEFLNLKWKNIDLKNRTIKIYSDNKNKGEGRLGYREILMHRNLYDLLITSEDTTGNVCPYSRTDSTKNAFRTLQQKTDIKATPYIFRKTFASLAAENGVPLDKLAHYMGNSAAILEKYYTKIDAQSYEKDIALIPSI